MIRALYFIMLISLVGCDYTDAHKQIEQLKANNTSLENSIRELSSKIEKIQKENENQNADLFEKQSVIEDLKKRSESHIDLSTHVKTYFEYIDRFPISTAVNMKTKDFSRIQTDYGMLLISCLDVQPYRDGSKVILNIGNVLAATLVNSKIEAEWGPQLSEESNYTEWLKKIKKNVFSISKEIPSGAWSIVELNLDGYPPNKLNYLNIKIEAPTVSLRSPIPK